jgi:hypothetical protein
MAHEHPATPAGARRGRPNDPPRKDDSDKQQREEERRRRRDELWRRVAHDRRHRYTPWLLLRYNLTDMGLRPMPANTPFWISPDIWVETTDLLGRPVAGQANYLHARVFNLGKAPAAPTRVQFYWGDPSIGLGSANMNLIGTEWVEIPFHGSKDVRCNTPWVPVAVNQGHECVIVNSSHPMLDPIIEPFHAWADRHVGQRNLTVIPGAPAQALKFKLAVNNFLPMLTRLRITARVEHVRVDKAAFRMMTQQDILHLAAAFGAPFTNTAAELMMRFQPATAEARVAKLVAPRLARFTRNESQFVRSVGFQTRSAACVHSRLAEDSCRTSGAEEFGAAGQLYRASAVLSPEARGRAGAREQLLHEVALEGNERRSLELELVVPGNAAPGEFVVFHFVQRTEGLPVGGYTVLVHVGG